MKKKNRFIRFFKDKSFRWAMKEQLILRFLSIKPILWLYCFCKYLKFEWKIRKLSRWEQYLKEKEYDENMAMWNFSAAVYNLLALLKIREPDHDYSQDFEHLKAEVLNCEIIQRQEYIEFKNWLEHTTYDTQEISYIEAFFDKLMSK